MAPRRPWRSRGREIIGWKDWGLQLPTVGRNICAQTRALPYYLPRRPAARPPTSPSLIPQPPDTSWIAAVERALGAEGVNMTDVWRYHSLRTWQFAAALAAEEHSGIEGELLYVAALLHDSGLFLSPDEGESFASAGARLARDTAGAAGVGAAAAELVATAIESHISMRPGNLLGEYLQFGSALDVAGMRIWKLDRGLVDHVSATWTRSGFTYDMGTRWTAECDRLPYGRAAYATCPGGLLLASRMAPLPEPAPPR